jgi:hypothetical protein
MQRHRCRIPILLLLVLALAALPASASARSSHRTHGHRVADRNRDGLPDAWERHFHLSLRVNEARRDQDHDGLDNAQEFKARLNPRSADSDGDGTPDAQEGAGKVVSFEGGVLTIALFGGEQIHGTVDQATELECESAQQAVQDDDQAEQQDRPTSGTTARAADDGPGEDDHGDAQQPAGAEPGSDDQGENDDQGDDEGDSSCPTTVLTAGAVVREAEASVGSGGLHFDSLEILTQ